MGELRRHRRFDIQTNSIALAPSGAFVAYIDRGVVIDDGRRRLFRGTAKRLTKSSNEIVRGALDDAVIISDTQHLKVVKLDGEAIDLLPCERHLALTIDTQSSTLSAVLGAQIVQFDTKTWARKRNIDLAAELDISHYSAISASVDWIVLSTPARFVVLDKDGHVETVLPGGNRHRPTLLGDALVAEKHPDTLVSKLASDDAIAVWGGETNTTWCGAAGELRGVCGPDVIVRTSLDAAPQRFALRERDASPDQTNYVVFAQEARRVARWFLHSKSFDIFEW